MTNTPQNEMSSRHTTKIKVYAIDDSDLIIRGIKNTIESAPERDFKFVGSDYRDAPDLVRRIKESEAEIVLVDILLGDVYRPEDIYNYPEKSGLEVIKKLRQKLGRHVKILAITQSPIFRLQAINAGANDFILKGLTNVELCQGLRNKFGHYLEDIFVLFCVIIRFITFEVNDPKDFLI